MKNFSSAAGPAAHCKRRQSLLQYAVELFDLTYIFVIGCENRHLEQVLFASLILGNIGSTICMQLRKLHSVYRVLPFECSIDFSILGKLCAKLIG